MQPISLTVPADQASAIAAEVQRPPGFDDAEPAVRVWIGPSLELVLTCDAADRLADALVDALAADDERRPVSCPALVNGW
jgi:hypothetical protein